MGSKLEDAWQYKVWRTLAVVLTLTICLPLTALAHPMGNFTINRYTRLELHPDQVQLYYIIDHAEVPALAELVKMDLDGNKVISEDEEHTYLDGQMSTLLDSLQVTIADEPLPLRPITARMAMPPGEDEMPTLRLEFDLAVSLPPETPPADGWQLTYRDSNVVANKQGWQEIIAKPTNDVTLLESSVPSNDMSNELRRYPDALLEAPIRVRTAQVRFLPLRSTTSDPTQETTDTAVVSPAITTSILLTDYQAITATTVVTASVVPVAATANSTQAIAIAIPGGVDAQSAESQELAETTQTVSTQRGLISFFSDGEQFERILSLPVTGPGAFLFALLAAFGWGGLHALSPGHGKTIVAAYLIGSRGTALHALFLGLTTTITHTLGVFALGLATLFISEYILPETLYPWLSILSGLLVVGVGFALLRSRWLGWRHGHDHEHDHTHDHHSHGADHDHDHHGHSHLPPETVTWRSLLALGVSGGLLPCPSALVVMLAAIAFGRIPFGLLMILVFSLGLATMLTMMGLLFVYAGRFFARFPTSQPLFRLLPVASALVVMVLGAGITWLALLQVV